MNNSNPLKSVRQIKDSADTLQEEPVWRAKDLRPGNANVSKAVQQENETSTQLSLHDVDSAVQFLSLKGHPFSL